MPNKAPYSKSLNTDLLDDAEEADAAVAVEKECNDIKFCCGLAIVSFKRAAALDLKVWISFELPNLKAIT